jgi:hypothetical protein
VTQAWLPEGVAGWQKANGTKTWILPRLYFTAILPKDLAGTIGAI